MLIVVDQRLSDLSKESVHRYSSLIIDFGGGLRLEQEYM